MQQMVDSMMNKDASQETADFEQLEEEPLKVPVGQIQKHDMFVIGNMEMEKENQANADNAIKLLQPGA